MWATPPKWNSRFFRTLLWSRVKLSLYWIGHLFPIIITPRSSNLVENLLSYEYFSLDCNFRNVPIICNCAVGNLEIGHIQRMTVHQKLLMKSKVLNQIWWYWCHNEKRLLYSVRWKKIIWLEHGPTCCRSMIRAKSWKMDLINCTFFILGRAPGIVTSLHNQ